VSHRNIFARLRRSSDERPLLDLCHERDVAACLYGARTGSVQAAPIMPPVPLGTRTDCDKEDT
jgi:hypothetical protein